MSNAAPAYTKPPLDESLYLAAEEDFAFIREQTGMHDPETLKKHILEVQQKAYDLYGHRCIRGFAFTRTRIATLPAYQAALTLGREREGAILLDLGCCFGTDIRKAASDGFPVQNLIASDLRPAFWNCGHELFQTNPDTFPIKFLAGDAFDPAFLAPTEPLTSQDEVSTPAPPLASLTSLTPLRGHVSALHTSSVFHLFFEAQQLQFARALASLLSPAPGSVIFGAHTGRRVKGFNMGGCCSGGHHMFCHSPETFREMWGEVFKEGTVKIEVELRPRQPDVHEIKSEDMGRLVWSVTRI
ncbi:hypothetical protein GGX14DRAFT_674926 [Mycena pura]|uniref:Methyltransferase domain-containing protein n=1 Tax=Mycena pura TaxID=153505 RepID=A0AAD6VSD4_9AGAR|nr:hypothetical protein GGX14DRAFT_674926 [Mycena pura]